MKMLFTCQLCNFERRDCLYCMINNVCFHCLSCFKREEGWNLCADFFSKKVAFYHFTICGHFGQGQNGQNRFRERGHCSLYININIYIIVADFDSLFSILTKMTMTTLTATRPRFFYGLKGPIGLAAKAALAPSLSL